MTLILAIEPDPRQASRLSAMMRGRSDTDLLISHSAETAIEAAAGRVPDVLLTSLLLSRQDEQRLADWLKELGPRAAHVQALTIPIFANASRKEERPRGLLAGLRGWKQKPQVDGCETRIFTEHVATYLEQAAAERSADLTIEAAAPVVELPPALFGNEDSAPVDVIGPAVDVVEPEPIVALVPELPEAELIEAALIATTEPVTAPELEPIETPAAAVESPMMTVIIEPPMALVAAPPMAEASEPPVTVLTEPSAEVAPDVTEPAEAVPEMLTPLVTNPILVAAEQPATEPVTFIEVATADIEEVDVPAPDPAVTVPLEPEFAFFVEVFAAAMPEEPAAPEPVVEAVWQREVPAQSADEGAWLLAHNLPVVHLSHEPLKEEPESVPAVRNPPQPKFALPREVEPELPQVAALEVVFTSPQIFRKREEVSERILVPRSAPTSRPVAAAPTTRRRTRTMPHPIQDEWGLFDPTKCGFAALLDKLDEITDGQSAGYPDANVRVLTY